MPCQSKKLPTSPFLSSDPARALWLSAMMVTTTWRIVIYFRTNEDAKGFVICKSLSEEVQLAVLMSSPLILTWSSQCICFDILGSVLADKMDLQILNEDGVATQPKLSFLKHLCHVTMIYAPVLHCLHSPFSRSSIIIFQQFVTILESVMPLKHLKMEHGLFPIYYPKDLKLF
jgi:hypothetical protein